jgi:thioredoxin-related protein
MGMIDTWFNACYIDASSDSLVVVWGSLMSCRAASEQYHVRSYPTTIAFNYNGRQRILFEGYYDPGRYADRLCLAYYSFKAK